MKSRSVNGKRPSPVPEAAWKLAVWKLGVAALCVAAVACSKPAPDETDSMAPVPVKVAPATAGSIRGVLHATGIVSPAPEAELIVVAPDSARIADIPHAEGERVAKGDVLVRFEIPALQAEVQRQAAEVQRAQATLANAKANQTREHELFDRGVAARKDMEDADRATADAEAGVAQAEASRAAAITAAARATVRATFNGVIAKRFHNPGDLVEAAASDPVLRVIDPRRLEVVASIPLSESMRVVVGAAAHLVMMPAGSPDLALKVVSRPAAVEQGTATIPVRLAFAAPTMFSVGTPVQVDIDAEEHTGTVLVPAPALVREGEDTAVFIVMGDKAQRKDAKAGLNDGTNVEILEGVRVGDSVIVDGQAGLPDGAKITIDKGEKEDGAKKDDAKDDEDDEK